MTEKTPMVTHGGQNSNLAEEICNPRLKPCNHSTKNGQTTVSNVGLESKLALVTRGKLRGEVRSRRNAR